MEAGLEERKKAMDAREQRLDSREAEVVKAADTIAQDIEAWVNKNIAEPRLPRQHPQQVWTWQGRHYGQPEGLDRCSISPYYYYHHSFFEVAFLQSSRNKSIFVF